MATRTKTVKNRPRGSESTPEGSALEQPRSLAIADRGIKTGGDFADLMSALMSDLIGGRVTPQIGNATCNAGGKLLKIVDMQYKYGTTGAAKGLEKRTLVLALEAPQDQVQFSRGATNVAADAH